MNAKKAKKIRKGLAKFGFNVKQTQYKVREHKRTHKVLGTYTSIQVVLDECGRKVYKEAKKR